MTVVDLKKARDEREKNLSEYSFTISIFRDGEGLYWGRVEADANPDHEPIAENPDFQEAEAFHHMADVLRSIAWQADSTASDSPGGSAPVATVVIYKNGLTRTVSNADDIQTPAQKDWIKRRLEDAHECLTDPKSGRQPKGITSVEVHSDET